MFWIDGLLHHKLLLLFHNLLILIFYLHLLILKLTFILVKFGHDFLHHLERWLGLSYCLNLILNPSILHICILLLDFLRMILLILYKDLVRLTFFNSRCFLKYLINFDVFILCIRCVNVGKCNQTQSRRWRLNLFCTLRNLKRLLLFLNYLFLNLLSSQLFRLLLQLLGEIYVEHLLLGRNLYVLLHHSLYLFWFLHLVLFKGCHLQILLLKFDLKLSNILFVLHL